VITGFEGTEMDLSPYVPRKKKLRVWGFDDKEREVLLTATTHQRSRVGRWRGPGFE
jgi:hypothetical protein